MVLNDIGLIQEIDLVDQMKIYSKLLMIDEINSSLIFFHIYYNVNGGVFTLNILNNFFLFNFDICKFNLMFIMNVLNTCMPWRTAEKWKKWKILMKMKQKKRNCIVIIYGTHHVCSQMKYEREDKINANWIGHLLVDSVLLHKIFHSFSFVLFFFQSYFQIVLSFYAENNFRWIPRCSFFLNSHACSLTSKIENYW